MVSSGQGTLVSGVLVGTVATSASQASRSAFTSPALIASRRPVKTGLSIIEEAEPAKPRQDTISDKDQVPADKSLKVKLGVTTSPVPPAAPKLWVVGHRGALYDELENTLPAFQRCLDLGCEAVELDVFWLEKDGSLIVFHGGGTDENPGDLTDYCLSEDGRSILDCQTYEETQKLVFNPTHEEFGCEANRVMGAQIPKLDEVLSLAKGTNMIVKIELKGEGCTLPVLELVDKMDMVDQCHFSSFDHSRLALVRKLHPERNDDGSYKYKTGALFDDVPSNYLAQAQAVGASEVHLRYDTCSRERVEEIHKVGMASMAWFRGPVGMKNDCERNYLDVGNEDVEMYETLLQTGVQQLCCNRPDVLAAYLNRQLNNNYA